MSQGSSNAIFAGLIQQLIDVLVEVLVSLIDVDIERSTLRFRDCLALYNRQAEQGYEKVDEDLAAILAETILCGIDEDDLPGIHSIVKIDRLFDMGESTFQHGVRQNATETSQDLALCMVKLSREELLF